MSLDERRLVLFFVFFVFGLFVSPTPDDVTPAISLCLSLCPQGHRQHHVHSLLPHHHLLPAGNLHRLLGRHSHVSFNAALCTNGNNSECVTVKYIQYSTVHIML